MSNLGGIDAREVAVAFSAAGKTLGETRVGLVPADKCGKDDRVCVRRRRSHRPGLDAFEAQVAKAPAATIQNGLIRVERVSP